MLGAFKQALLAASSGGVDPIVATGGTITDVGGYRYHTFNASGTFAVSAIGADGATEYLAIGGGGGGGQALYASNNAGAGEELGDT